MANLDGEVAVVLGSTRGVGAGIAEKLAADGAAVVITGRSEADGKQVADAINAAGHRALFVRTDVGVESEVKNAIDTAAAEFAAMTTLVCNAAAMELTFETGGLHDNKVDLLENEAWDTMIRNSLTYVFWASKHSIPHMRKAGHGSIINISSASSLAGVGGHPAYCTAKAGMNGLTRSIADAYASENIRCNAIVLGFVSTSPEVDAMVAALGDRLTKTQMMPRPATVGEIGAFASFLASKEAYPITGASLTVDNGWTNKLPLIDPHDIEMGMAAQT